VGKTSCAAARALEFSKRGKKTLIVSVDPAHSLSDSFGESIGGDVKKLAKNLFAVEIDPAKAMSEYKERFSSQIEQVDGLAKLGIGETFDIAGMTPGIDEIAAFDKFLHYMQNKEYDIVIFDTAPTGHALRFLSLPDVLDSWLGKMIKIRMRFSGMLSLVKKVLPFGSEDGDKAKKFGADELEKMKERISQAKEILSDPGKTHYNLVLIPEAMSILESKRSLKTLKEYRRPVQNIIVNQVIPENSSCAFCTDKRASQLKRVEEIRKAFSGMNILLLPLFREEVRGMESLERVGKSFYK
jgi:arsenite-transporting ATPase